MSRSQGFERGQRGANPGNAVLVLARERQNPPDLSIGSGDEPAPFRAVGSAVRLLPDLEIVLVHQRGVAEETEVDLRGGNLLGDIEDVLLCLAIGRRRRSERFEDYERLAQLSQSFVGIAAD